MRLLLLLFMFCPFAAAAQENYTISTLEELAELRDSVNGGKDFSSAVIRLEADLTLPDETEWVPIGTTSKPFQGTFDGQGHWINNLTVNVDGLLTGNTAGFFGCIGEGGKVSRLGIASGTIRVATKHGASTNSCFSGAIAGQCAGTIDQCANEATVYGNLTYANVGGIVGELTATGKITNCYNRGRLYTSKKAYTDYNLLGGIAGNCDGTIENVYVSANVEAAKYRGGIVAVYDPWIASITSAYYDSNVIQKIVLTGSTYVVQDTEFATSQEDMLGYSLDGKLCPTGDYSIWTFAEGEFPKLSWMSDTLWGDVNRDKKITIADVTALVNIILGKDSTEPYVYDHEAADVNRDKSITIADVTALVNIILGK